MRRVEEFSTDLDFRNSSRKPRLEPIDRALQQTRAVVKPVPTIGPSARASEILKSFNTWSFKREQPDDTGLLLARLQQAVEAGAPLDFVLYWGKGPRSHVAEPDLQCLQYLVSMRARIEAVYAPGVQFTLIMTDTHARLNGHAEEAIDSYFREVQQVAGQLGFGFVFLSELVSTQGTDVDMSATPPTELLDHLASCAAKWYRGPSDSVSGALTYYRMNMVEKNAVERSFPAAVFVTFNGSDLRDLFPDNMPIFYMYSLKRGTAEKPWFLPRIKHLTEAELV